MGEGGGAKEDWAEQAGEGVGVDSHDEEHFGWSRASCAGGVEDRGVLLKRSFTKGTTVFRLIVARDQTG